MDHLKYFLSVLGCIALFSFSVKYLSEVFQVLWGKLAHQIFSGVSNNPLRSIGVGFLTTLVLQSSSVSSIMLIGSINTGLVNFYQGLYFVFGSNIGITFMGWLVSFPIYGFCFLFLSLGFLISVLFPQRKIIEIGKIIFSLGLIFLSLFLMHNLLNSSFFVEMNIELGKVFAEFTVWNWLIATVLFSAVIVLTRENYSVLVLAFAGYQLGIFTDVMSLFILSSIPVGTSVMGFIACLKAKNDAKKVFATQAIVSISGLVLLIIFSAEFFEFIEVLFPQSQWIIEGNANQRHWSYLPILQLLYSIFLIVLGVALNRFICRFLSLFIKEKKEKEMQSLRFWGGNFNFSPSLAIEQSYQELKKTTAMTHAVLILVTECIDKKLFAGKEKKINKDDLVEDHSLEEVLEQITKYEDIIDNVQDEISDFLNRMMQEKITEEQAMKVQSLIRVINNLESITDHCLNLISIVKGGEFLLDEESFRKETFRILHIRLEKILSLFEVLFNSITEEKSIDGELVENKEMELIGDLECFYKSIHPEGDDSQLRQALNWFVEVEGVKKSCLHIIEALQDEMRGGYIKK